MSNPVEKAVNDAFNMLVPKELQSKCSWNLPKPKVRQHERKPCQFKGCERPNEDFFDGTHWHPSYPNGDPLEDKTQWCDDISVYKHLTISKIT